MSTLPNHRLRIVIPGGTGQLGTMLARHFHEQGHSVATITRFPKPQEWDAIHWDAANPGHWASSLEAADVVINLAGRSVRCRHNQSNRQAIFATRVRSTELLAQAISVCSQPPRLWLNASTAGIYRETFDREMDELTAEFGTSFTASMTRKWEAAVRSTATPNTRKILLRMAPVMSLDKGRAFDHWFRLVRSGLGGEVAGGEQYVTWIHDFDFVRAIEFLIQHEDIGGPVNVAAPESLPNHQFLCNLRRAWCTSYFGLPMPEWLVRTSAFLLRTEAEPVLQSTRVFPRRLLDAGFSFHFPAWRGACANLVDRWRLLNAD